MNFISNAIKFTFEGNIQITASFDLPRPNIIKIVIKDSGIGISKEN